MHRPQQGWPSKSELILAVGIVRIEDIPQDLDVFLLLRALVPKDTVPAGHKGGRQAVARLLWRVGIFVCRSQPGGAFSRSTLALREFRQAG